MTTIRQAVAAMVDRIRGWLYFAAFATMASALWVAAWAQSLERDFDRSWLAPSIGAVALQEDTDFEVTRCNAGPTPVEDAHFTHRQGLWTLDPTTRPGSRDNRFAGQEIEP